MLKTLRQIATIGIVTEPPPKPDESLSVREALQERIRTVLGRALCIRHVDAGSCNGCELEIHALNNPLYNLEGLGIRFVASPRHADLLLVTGPVSRHMEAALLRTYEVSASSKSEGGIIGAKQQIATHTPRQIDYYRGIDGSDALIELAKECRVAARLTGNRITHVQMHNRSPRRVRFESSCGNLFRCYRNVRALAGRVA